MKSNTKLARPFGLLLILLCGGISIWWGNALSRAIPGGPIDFQAIYYGSLTLLHHRNPYNVSQVEQVIHNVGGDRVPLPDALRSHRCITLYVNLPPTLLFLAPFALLPLPVAQVLWTSLTAVSIMLAAFLIWDIAVKDAPILVSCLVGFLVANCQILFGTCNTAGIVVGLCVIGAWCFVRERCVAAGILCMGLSLAIKPHDAGLVWLFFLLGGVVSRKRALQALAVTVALAAAGALWVSLVVPHWMQDWRANMAAISAPGGLNDPRPASVMGSSAGNVISLQAVFSVFRSDAQFYNLASYEVCGALLLVWLIVTLRSRPTPQRAWFALAAVVPLTVLVTYHRVYDAKLLLLTIPACALLWAEGGRLRWIAAAFSGVCVLLNGDIPLTILGEVTGKLQLSTATLAGQLATVVLTRPNQEILLAMGVFYLWVYVGRSVPAERSCRNEPSAGIPVSELSSVS